MSARTLDALEDAIRDHFLDTIEDTDSEALKSAVIVDWVAGFTISNIVEVDGRNVVGFSNGYIGPDTNPNSQVALAGWVSDQIADILNPQADD